MPSAFSTEEQKSIRAALLQSAQHHALSTGMKCVTVEDLAREVGISKGAFYHFYDNKEQLFLDMMEDYCCQLINRLSLMKKTLQNLSSESKSEKLLREGLREFMNPSFSRFFLKEVPALLRKLTPQEKKAHFSSVDEYLLDLIQNMGIRLHVPESIAISSIKLLVLCAAHNTDYDENHTDAVNLLAEGLCHNLVEN